MKTLIFLCGIALISLTGCTSKPIASDLSILKFPEVEGKALSGESFRLPERVSGTHTVILVGLVQKAQFDIDRWILGLMQLKVPARIVEVPTIAGMIPTIISDRIDAGMKRGIPEEDWPSVVTVYGSEAEKIVKVTGTENAQNGHVVLLDKNGQIIWRYDRGYSAAKVLELQQKISDQN